MIVSSGAGTPLLGLVDENGRRRLAIEHAATVARRQRQHMGDVRGVAAVGERDGDAFQAEVGITVGGRCDGLAELAVRARVGRSNSPFRGQQDVRGHQHRLGLRVDVDEPSIGGDEQDRCRQVVECRGQRQLVGFVEVDHSADRDSAANVLSDQLEAGFRAAVEQSVALEPPNGQGRSARRVSLQVRIERVEQALRLHPFAIHPRRSEFIERQDIRNGMNRSDLQKRARRKQGIQGSIFFEVELSVVLILAPGMEVNDSVTGYVLVEKVCCTTLNEAANGFQRIRPERRIQCRVINPFDKPGELLDFLHSMCRKFNSA